MKSIITLTFTMFILISVNAQWTMDPENPMVVCDAAGIENNITVFTDEMDGIYVFWLDTRNSSGFDAREVYGQYYSSSGVSQWETNGRLIVSHYNKISNYGVFRFNDGSMIIGWSSKSDSYTYNDSTLVRKIDNDGLPVWTDDLLVLNAGFEPNAILSPGEFQVIKDGLSYCMAIYVTHYGGSSAVRMTRFDENGNLLLPPDGTQVAGPGGIGHAVLLSTFENDNSSYLYYSGGNGAGAPLYCVRLNSAGNVIWGPENVIEGTTGLKYQFDAISDPAGITFVWEGSGNNTDLFTCRYLSNGTPDWGGNVVPISNVEGQQTIFDLKKSGNHYYITWADGRPGVDPGNYDIYAQVFDMNGAMQFEDDGIEIMSFNTYIPHPKMAVTQDLGFVVCHQSTIAGYMAQKINSDGTPGWDSSAVQVAVSTLNPFYSEHALIRSGDRIIAVWADAAPGGGSNDVYISPVNTVLTTGFKPNRSEGFRMYPNPANTVINIVFDESGKNANVGIYSLDGRQLYQNYFESLNTGYLQLKTLSFPEGVYFIRVETEGNPFTGKFIIQR
ncbi:MAG: T9SS type A sorting domain-containing protein [Bacteroidales bacterium]